MSEKFNEKTHAYLIGLFYKHLKAQHGDSGLACFVKSTQKCAEQRGARMALRALRDGYPLNFNAYMAYGEWVATFPNKSREIGTYPDCQKEIHACAWHDTFVDMDLLECGMLYCKEIDRGIVRGFNPDLQFELKSFLHNNPVCNMVFKNAYLDDTIPRKPESKRTWEYHCGHVYKTYLENAQAIFGNTADLQKSIDADFANKFGETSLSTVHTFMDTDFNTI